MFLPNDISPLNVEVIFYFYLLALCFYKLLCNVFLLNTNCYRQQTNRMFPNTLCALGLCIYTVLRIQIDIQLCNTFLWQVDTVQSASSLHRWKQKQQEIGFFMACKQYFQFIKKQFLFSLFMTNVLHKVTTIHSDELVNKPSGQPNLFGKY